MTSTSVKPGVLEQLGQGTVGAESANGPGTSGSGGSAWPSSMSALARDRRPRVALRARPRRPARRGLRPAARAGSPAPPPPGSTASMIPQRTSTASTLAVSRSIHSSSSWRNSTLSMPASAARRRATSIIGSAPSLEMSVPPGLTSSAAMKPVSPGPAASSSTRWPGCRSSDSTIATETGMPQSRTRSARLPQPPAAVSHVSRVSGAQLLGVGGRHTTQVIRRACPRPAGPIAG